MTKEQLEEKVKKLEQLLGARNHHITQLETKLTMASDIIKTIQKHLG